MKSGLLGRMRTEMEEQTEGYLIELDQMREQLVEERQMKKQLEGKMELVNLERDHFEEMYRDLMEKYKTIVQADINLNESIRNRRDVIESYPMKREKTKHETEVSISGTKGKTTKKPKRQKEEKDPTLSLPKEQLIPFLAQGISELKDKLSIK